MTELADVQTVASTMDATGLWWAVAGGWAIDLWLGEQTREHHDIEVVVRRCDQRLVHDALVPTHALFCLDPPGSGWREWTGEPIGPPAFQLQARSPQVTFDLFAEDVDDTTWRYRRHQTITRPVAAVTTVSAGGIPVVVPEVQLLYAATSDEPKHRADFERVLPRLESHAAAWLAGALNTTMPGVTKGAWHHR